MKMFSCGTLKDAACLPEAKEESCWWQESMDESREEGNAEGWGA